MKSSSSSSFSVCVGARALRGAAGAPPAGARSDLDARAGAGAGAAFGGTGGCVGGFPAGFLGGMADASARLCLSEITCRPTIGTR